MINRARENKEKWSADSREVLARDGIFSGDQSFGKELLRFLSQQSRRQGHLPRVGRKVWSMITMEKIG